MLIITQSRACLKHPALEEKCLMYILLGFCCSYFPPDFSLLLITGASIRAIKANQECLQFYTHSGSVLYI